MKLSRIILGICAVAILSSCGLPRSGPNKREILAGSVEKGGTAYVVPVTSQIAQIANQSPSTGFPASFLTGGPINTDVIRRGDVLSMIVYENVQQGVLGGVGAPSQISALRVDQNGTIFVPFAGTITAAGKTMEGLRQELTEALERQTPDPQIQLLREEGLGTSVTVLGQGNSGAFQIDSSTRRLSELLAASGAASPAEDPAGVRVSVARGNQEGEIFLSDLYRDPRNNIFIRPGDRISIRSDDRRFTLLGALGGQGFVEFPKPDLSILEALSLAGGLSVTSSDPKGIFVFRNEAQGFAQGVTGNKSLQGAQQLIYVVDLTKPNGIFIARDFRLKDGDTVYVTEAPFTQWTKTLNAILTTATTAENITQIGQ